MQQLCRHHHDSKDASAMRPCTEELEIDQAIKVNST